MNNDRRTFRWLSLLFLLAGTSALRAETLSTGKWLNDLGRNYPLSRQAGATLIDAEIAYLFMDAATRVQPDLAEAHRWTYDLLSALGRWDEAHDAIGRYVRLQPGDMNGWLVWLEFEVEAYQLAEDRARFYREQLRRGEMPEPVRSVLHRQLAEYHLNRNETDAARTELRDALRTDPFNLPARQLLQSLDSEGANEAIERLRRLLDILRTTPADEEAAMELGRILEQHGRPEQADRWYRHVEALQRLMPPGEVSIPVRIARTRALIDMGRFDEAADIIQQVIAWDDSVTAAYLLMARIDRKRGNREEARSQVIRARRALDTLLKEATGELNPDMLAEIAWFWVHQGAKPVEAERLARTLLADAPDLVLAHRTLGATLLKQESFDEARQSLEPVAERDAWSGLLLAECLHALGRQDAARRQLLQVARQPAGGELRERAGELMQEWGIAAPGDPPLPGAEALLQEFPDEVLDYPHHPERYLRLSLSISNEALSTTEPWLCTFRMENIGTFPIILGPGYMVNPEVLCAIETQGDDFRTSGPTIRVTFPHQKILPPGEALQHEQTIEIGKIRQSMIGTPQVTHDVIAQAILSPMPFLTQEGEEIWAPAIGGLASDSIEFRRRGFVARSEELRQLFVRSNDTNLNDRLEATELLAMLMAESQHLAANRLNYAVPRIDMPVARDAFLARTRDADWRVRARAAEAMRWFVLDKTANQAAARLLNDPHWCVRGLIMRTLTDHHGERFRPVLANRADAETHDWPKHMARALLTRLDQQQQASLPDETSASGQGPISDRPEGSLPTNEIPPPSLPPIPAPR